MSEQQEGISGGNMVFFDVEASDKIREFGAVRTEVPIRDLNTIDLRTASGGEFTAFLTGARYLCGHNILRYDMKMIRPYLPENGSPVLIDTLPLSPLLFPRKPYHRLVKNDKLYSEEWSNPVNDSKKAMELFLDELKAYRSLDARMRRIYTDLLSPQDDFAGFFRFLEDMCRFTVAVGDEEDDISVNRAPDRQDAKNGSGTSADESGDPDAEGGSENGREGSGTGLTLLEDDDRSASSFHTDHKDASTNRAGASLAALLSAMKRKNDAKAEIIEESAAENTEETDRESLPESVEEQNEDLTAGASEDAAASFEDEPEEASEGSGDAEEQKNDARKPVRELDEQAVLLLAKTIREAFYGRICENAPIGKMIRKRPVELAYALALISAGEKEHSQLPMWVLNQYPFTLTVYNALRGTICKDHCGYCRKKFNPVKQLQDRFGYPSFRSYGGEPLQERAVRAAVEGKSLLAVFPTGGGKSLTFQLPALMASDAVGGLTVVISPLQSLMKDQVDNLAERGIVDAVAINGLLSPVERGEAVNRVENGMASILYISPESLRSRTVERLLMGRNVVRFVIDEAHCFSAWGQDFRVDYLYIGDFIAELQKKKHTKIPVSCFTATAKQKVISDIKAYFQRKLGVSLELFTTDAARENLRYEVLYRATEQEKYETLRALILEKQVPTIVYVSRVRKTKELAEHLCADGIAALPYNGKMDPDEKVEHQNRFKSGEVDVMVATSAFGMGVDKKDVGLVVHYEISDSLENYVQEAGRAGRDEKIEAECIILFHESDLDKHFLMLGQSKLSMGEIAQVWRGIKELSKRNPVISVSALELARASGWKDDLDGLETKVKTAVQSLEEAGMIRRSQNVGCLYADSIVPKNMIEARQMIDQSALTEKDRQTASRLISMMISVRSRFREPGETPESRIDYMADRLGLASSEVITVVEEMREAGILSDHREMYVDITENRGAAARRTQQLKKYMELERFFAPRLDSAALTVNYKKWNEEALDAGLESSVKLIQKLLYFWTIMGYIEKPRGAVAQGMQTETRMTPDVRNAKMERRFKLAQYMDRLFSARAKEELAKADGQTDVKVDFSITEVRRGFDAEEGSPDKATVAEVEEAILYLQKNEIYRVDGGFLVLYNRMRIERIVQDNKIQYKKEDYRKLSEYYQNRILQIHIVGEYANMMVSDYDAALAFVNDYFQMDHQLFLTKYFKGKREVEITRNITPMKYDRLFADLSEAQSEIIKDDTHSRIMVAAGPGSGKTKILVHKLASLMLMEDVKHDQLLMLTFSRAAAMEFRVRLHDLIGDAAYFVEIKTFHSYAFDLLGRIGSLKGSDSVVQTAADEIRQNNVVPERISKTVLVIDEAQDMDEHEYSLVSALMEYNEDMRVILVGDDDQNIYEFRGSDSRYMAMLAEGDDTGYYTLAENYRSSRFVTAFSNCFVSLIENRFKEKDIIPVRTDDGEVHLTYAQWAVIPSTVQTFLDHYKKGSGRRTAILTRTNEEAERICAVLTHMDYPVRMVSSMEGYSVKNLMANQYFLAILRKVQERNFAAGTTLLSGEDWDQCVEVIKTKFAGSTDLACYLQLYEEYRKSCGQIFLSDFEEYLGEVRAEDFQIPDNEEIYLSTLHKVKGLEFDDVFIALDKAGAEDRQVPDSERRVIYVGMTRARERLFINYNSARMFRKMKQSETFKIQLHRDETEYQEAKEILMSMGLKSIYLSYDNGLLAGNEAYLKVLPGTELTAVEGTGQDGSTKLYFEAEIDGNPVRMTVASKTFVEQYEKYKERGYMIGSAKVAALVCWQNTENKDERRVLVLPELRLKVNPRRMAGKTGGIIGGIFS